MKNFKKLFASVAIVAMLASSVPTTVLGAASYSDELQGAYDYSATNGITSASAIDNADMFGSLTRVAMAKMMANYAIEVLGQTPDTAKACTFADVSSALDAQYDNGVTKACQLGLMGVGITKFNPNGLVTRAQFGTVLSRALYGDVNNDGDPYYVNHLAALKDAGIMTNISNPNANEVRGYVMLMMQRADEGTTTPAICTTPENVLSCSLNLDTCPTECRTIVANGSASVSLDGSVSTQSVPKNAKSVKVGTIKLTAGENDTTVSSVVVTRSGLGNVADVKSIQLVLPTNSVPATDSRVLSTSTQSATLRFSPSIILKAGSSMSFDVVVSLSGAENNQHNFAVTAVNVANGTATGLPVTLGTLNTTSYNAGSVSISRPTDNSIVAGKTAQTITTVDVIPTKDAIIKGFTLTKQSGEDFTKALENVKAYYNGVVIGTVVVTAEKITVSNLNINRLNGETASIELKADGVYIGTASSTVFNALNNDVLAIEKSSGFSMTVTGTELNGTLTLSTIDLTLTKATTGSKTVAPGTSSVELYNARVTSNTTFDISNYKLELVQGTGFSTGFIDGKVTAYINGVDYELTNASTTFSASADAFRVEPGTAVTIRVVGNVKSTATAGVTYQMKLTLNTAKNVNNGSTVTLVGKDLLGDTVVVNNGTYTVVKPTSIPTNKTVLEGSASDMLYFNVRAAAENQVLKSVSIASISGGNFDTYATKVALMQGTTEVKAITNSTDLTTGVLIFDTLSTNLSKDATLPFTVRVTLKAGEVENLGTTIKLGLGAISVVRSVSQSTATTTSSTLPLAGNAYQVASSIPTVALPAQVGKNTTIQMTSTSSYDVKVISGTVEMTRNLNNGTYVNWNASAVNLLDSINGLSIGTVVGTGPGLLTLTFTDLTVGTSPVDSIIELVDNANTITDADYTVTVKNVTFQYVDKNDGHLSNVITESYNVAK